MQHLHARLRNGGGGNSSDDLISRVMINAGPVRSLGLWQGRAGYATSQVGSLPMFSASGPRFI
jgi:hypothetical protein